MRNARWYSGVTLVAMAACAALRAQEQPLSVRGTFSTGYYNTTTRGEANQSLEFVPFGAKFEITGYFKSADLLNYTVQPELNAGPQASEAGFQGGNGIQLHLTFLRKLIPLTFRYSNIQVEDVYFGGLTQISGYSLKNRNKDLGLTLELKNARLPETTIDWGVSSVNSTSATQGISDYVSQSNHLNVDSKYERWKWVFDGFLHRQRQESDLLEPVEGGTHFGTLKQTVVQYQVAARRDFLTDSEFYVDAGRQATSSLLFTLPIDLATRYASANLRLFQRRRWRASLRAGYTSNLASQLLAQAVGSLNGANSFAQDQTLLVPFSRGASSYNLNGTTNVTIGHGLGAYAAVERNALVTSSQENPLSADYFTTSAGLTYTHKLGWGNIAGEYGREFGMGSITGESGTIQGQTWRASVQRGRTGGLQLDATVHGAGQSIDNAQPISNRSVAVEGSLADRFFRDFSGRIGGGWQWGTIVNSANEFRTNGYTARAGIEHPRVQINATLNDSSSNSIPFYSDLLGGLGLGSALFVPLHAIPSDYRAMSFTVHSNPLRKVELSAVWTRSRQHLDSILNNDFEYLNIFVTYHFRRIRMEAGFTRTDQTFALYPFTLRKRFYIRFVRSAKLI